ncbi:hypothetical protein ACIP5N_22130 [Streptomyces sp. NPDC088768]|uniref:hypothetical protein n=1 Tax=Streptomyces sp. NPDC088768 TaxID=3365894 RepID=UPI003804A805
MVTARYTLNKGWSTRFYVIGSVDDGWAAWLRVRRGGLVHFIATDLLPLDAPCWPVSDSKCRCGKHAEPTRWRALHVLAGIQLDRLRDEGAEQEKRAYRCRYDARRWHFTSQAEQNPGPWKGAAAAL